MTRVLIIAGTDSSGGAGVARDVAVATHFGYETSVAITAVTAQTNDAVQRIHPVPPDIAAAQISSALSAETPLAIKIGMLGGVGMRATIKALLGDLDIPIVLDPVLKSSSGGVLCNKGEVASLLSVASLVTPNLEEAAALTGLPLAKTADDLAAQAERLRGLGARSVLLKGGHAVGTECVDHLFGASGRRHFTAPRLRVTRRGTGCTLATAIACNLASGFDVPAACDAAKKYVHQWLSDGLDAYAAG